MALRVAVDLNLHNIINESPIGLDELAVKTKAESNVLSKISRTISLNELLLSVVVRESS
jgi:hypothetical protein